MYGPYPAFGLTDTGQLDPATGTLYWILSSTLTSPGNYDVVVSSIGRDLVLHYVTCSCNGCGTGGPHGPLLRDHSNGNLYIYVESSYAYGTWFQFAHDGTPLANLGALGFADGPLRARQDAILDGNGNLIYLTDVLGHAVVTIITLSPFEVQGSASLTYSGSSRVAIGASNSIWVISTDGTDGAIDLITLNTPPTAPTITSFSLGAGGAFVLYTIEYDATDDTLLFWWNNLLNKWSCSSHTVVNSVDPSGYAGSGPLQGGLLTSGISFFVASSLDVSPITGVGFNPGLPAFNLGVAFKHFYDSTFEVVWLQANDTNVYGAILGGFPITLSCASGTGQVGVPYSSALVATGGTPPYTFSITEGSLPPGLLLDASSGIITGIPTTPGTYPYTSEVTDSLDATATASCAIIISAVNLCPPCRSLKNYELTRDLDADWDDNSTFFITQDVPFPFTLRGLVLRMSYNQD